MSRREYTPQQPSTGSSPPPLHIKRARYWRLCWAGQYRGKYWPPRRCRKLGAPVTSLSGRGQPRLLWRSALSSGRDKSGQASYLAPDFGRTRQSWGPGGAHPAVAAARAQHGPPRRPQAATPRPPPAPADAPERAGAAGAGARRGGAGGAAGRGRPGAGGRLRAGA